jgi:hypothetical protein
MALDNNNDNNNDNTQQQQQQRQLPMNPIDRRNAEVDAQLARLADIHERAHYRHIFRIARLRDEMESRGDGFILGVRAQTRANMATIIATTLEELEGRTNHSMLHRAHQMITTWCNDVMVWYDTQRIAGKFPAHSNCNLPRR